MRWAPEASRLDGTPGGQQVMGCVLYEDPLVSSLLRKLALGRCELELLRSHPKDERGSVREIGLCVRMQPTLHFLELSPTLWWELPRCSECSFSGPFWDPEREREWIPKWTRNGTQNGSQKGYSTLEPGSFNPETRIRNSNSNSIVELKGELELKLGRQA